METVLGTGVSVAAVTTAATPLAGVGIALALAFVVAPNVAKRAIRFVKGIA